MIVVEILLTMSLIMLILSRRELIRKRQTGAEKRKKRIWNVGDICRAVYSEDGLEYEGKLVDIYCFGSLNLTFVIIRNCGVLQQRK